MSKRLIKRRDFPEIYLSAPNCLFRQLISTIDVSPTRTIHLPRVTVIPYFIKPGTGSHILPKRLMHAEKKGAGVYGIALFDTLLI
jgi:hypothetical protein